MTRIVKTPEERRKELMDIAERLFSERGYEQTTVSDIVKAAKVAQGTFYYYFRTKDDMLDAIIHRYMDELEELMAGIIEEEKMNAVQKFFALFKHGKEFRESHEGLMNYIHEKKNELLHFRLEQKNTPLIARYFARIIKQGVKEGVFDTSYPFEAALAIMATSSTVGHGIHLQTLDKEELMRLFIVNLDLMERILGAKPGTFRETIQLLEVKQ